MKRIIINHFHIHGNYISGQYSDIHNNPFASFHIGMPSVPLRTQPLSDQAEETKQEDASTVLAIPHEGRYTEVRQYIDERCRFDEDFKSFCKNHTLRDLCSRLTDEFGWFVDENSLQRNINRNR